MTKEHSLSDPPTSATSSTAHWSYLVWQHLPHDGQWYCVAAFVSGVDARDFIRNQSGRVGVIVMQTPNGVTMFPTEIKQANSSA